MVAVDESIVVALILSIGAFAGVIVSAGIGFMASRRTKSEKMIADARKDVSVVEMAQKVLGQTIKTQREELDRQDKEIAKLRAGCQHLKNEVGRLEGELGKLRGL